MWGFVVIFQSQKGFESKKKKRFDEKPVETVRLQMRARSRLYYAAGGHISGFFMYYTLTYLYYIVTYSMEQSPSWEANRFSVSQEIPRILWNPKVH
jgi:hypothetical protein